MNTMYVKTKHTGIRKIVAKGTSSLVYCQERHSCRSEKTIAASYCKDCVTHQCVDCRREIHQLPAKEDHDIETIAAPPPGKLCQNKACSDVNFATVTCTTCQLNYCNLCFAKLHSQGKKQAHHKKKFVYVEAPEIISATNYTADIFSAINDFDSLENPGFEYRSLDNHSPESRSLEYTTLDSSLHSIENTHHENVSQELAPLERCDSGQHSHSDIEYSEDFYGTTESVQMDHSVATQPKHRNDQHRSFLLMNQEEALLVDSEAEFFEMLKVSSKDVVKVVSIFGNTGDGKSHTLNHTFFQGRQIFRTSSDQTSCTAGVWAAHDADRQTIVIDTEGLLGVSNNQNQRTRLLLKVLAISDIVIYRTRADRLHNDMFSFLADASKSYVSHFKQELQSAARRFQMDLPMSAYGPAVVIFHETTHTDVLKDGSDVKLLKQRFKQLELSIDAFCELHYVGTRTSPTNGNHTNFQGFRNKILQMLKNNSIRSHRNPSVVYKSLQILNDKFIGHIENPSLCSFPDQYFTCSEHCLSCGGRCESTMNHKNASHTTKNKCRYQHQYDNKIFICRGCHERGKEMIVVPKTSASDESSWFGLAKYAWSGYVLECPSCGIIYRSRQYWYGNLDPEQKVVRTEIRHVWKGSNTVLQGTHNAGRRLLDSLNYAKSTVSTYSAKPTKMIGNWITDQIAPPYWKPNSEITECHICTQELTEVQIHHCRSCGNGFCDDCSTRKKPVPERGWGNEPVRVCDHCYEQGSSESSPVDPTQLRARRVGEAVGSTFDYIANAVDYPLEILRDSARPAYWKADADITSCVCCKEDFGPKLSLHHCRKCGDGVCDSCSPHERPVPSRGWDYPVRVCNNCHKTKGNL